jgi:hypothetical protein
VFWGENEPRNFRKEVAVESTHELLSVKGPASALCAIRANAARVIALTRRNLLEVTGLGVGQINKGVDSFAGQHPLRGAMAPVAKVVKLSTSSIECVISKIATSDGKKPSKDRV